MKIKLQAGFTFIELMIVVAIIGILGMVGWPMYLEQGRTNNRTDAILATNAVHLALTKFESDAGGFTWTTPPGAVTAANAHNRYLPNVGIPGPGIGLASGTVVTDNLCTAERGFRWVPANGRYESCKGLYSIVVDIGAPGAGDGVLGPSFFITTTAIAAGPQSNDFWCNAFTLTNNGVRGHSAIDGPGANDPTPVTDQAAAGFGGATSDGPIHSTKRCWGSS